MFTEGEVISLLYFITLTQEQGKEQTLDLRVTCVKKNFCDCTLWVANEYIVFTWILCMCTI